MTEIAKETAMDRRPSAVQDAVDRIDVELSAVGNAVDELWKRLAPILGPEEPEGDRALIAAFPDSAPLVSSLHHLATEAAGHRERLVRLLGRITV